MTDDKTKPREHHGMNVSGLRRSATGFVLDREDLANDPVIQFEGWFREQPGVLVLSEFAGAAHELEQLGHTVETIDYQALGRQAIGLGEIFTRLNGQSILSP